MSNPLIAQMLGEPVAAPRSHAKALLAHLESVMAHPRSADLLNPEMAAAGDGYWPADGDWRQAFRPYQVQNGVLLIPVKGVLLHNFPWQLGNWATGYEYIWRAFVRGCEDSEVRGIALVEHSVGGFVSGLYDCIDKMIAAKAASGKPVRSFAHDMAYSAAYAVFCVGDHGTMSQTAGVGSIGTMLTHEDWSKYNEQLGVDVTHLAIGKHKTDGNPDEPLSDETKKLMMARLNELNELFINTVARGRKMYPQAVRNLEARTFGATEATSNGLADEVGSLDDALSAFADFLDEPSDNQGEVSMADEVTQTVDQAVHDAAVAAARSAGEATGLTNAQERMKAIIESEEAKTRPVAAMAAALDSDMTVEKARAFLAKLPEEGAAPGAGNQTGTTPFDAAMNGGNPGVGAGDGGDNKTPTSRADSVFALRGKAKPVSA